ncbi:MAG: hypothetical protein JWR26_2868 [Pedosphaera sp.]|nr:hypothetical protein [Pedosphaera sp.]
MVPGNGVLADGHHLHGAPLGRGRPYLLQPAVTQKLRLRVRDLALCRWKGIPAKRRLGGEVLAHGHYGDRNGRRTDGAVEDSGADFWFYVAAPGDGRAPLQRGLAVSLHAHVSRGAMPGAARNTTSLLQLEEGKTTSKMVNLFRKRVRIIRLPPASTALGGGLLFFTGLGWNLHAGCHAEGGFEDMNLIGAKDSRDLKDGKDLKDAAGCLGGVTGLADGARWSAFCCTAGGSAKGEQRTELPLENGVRRGSIGLQRPVKARKGRIRPDISDAFVFSGEAACVRFLADGQYQGNGVEISRLIWLHLAWSRILLCCFFLGVCARHVGETRTHTDERCSRPRMRDSLRSEVGSTDWLPKALRVSCPQGTFASRKAISLYRLLDCWRGCLCMATILGTGRRLCELGVWFLAGVRRGRVAAPGDGRAVRERAGRISAFATGVD